MEKLAISQPRLDLAKSAPAKQPANQVDVPTLAAVTQQAPVRDAQPTTGAPAGGGQPAQDSKLKDLQRLADDAFEDENVRLSISFDKSVGRFIYRGIDRETGEVVTEYPPEEILDRIAAMREYAGIIVDRKL